MEKLAKLFSECLRNLNVPIAWKNANIFLVYKKAGTKVLKKNMPISLLSVVYKLFPKVIVNRKNDSLDLQQPREPAGFRKRFSTIDHIHFINKIIEKSTEYNKPLYMAFIDNEKAFDSVDTAAVLEEIKDQEIEETYIRLLDDIYKGIYGQDIPPQEKRKVSGQKGSTTGR